MTARMPASRLDRHQHEGPCQPFPRSRLDHGRVSNDSLGGQNTCQTAHSLSGEHGAHRGEGAGGMPRGGSCARLRTCGEGS